MTVGVGIKCTDGIVLACDSMATFGRGVPILRYTNKVRVLDHAKLIGPVALLGAGLTTYVDKFLHRASHIGIDLAQRNLRRKLDIVDFCEHVGEPVVSALLKEYGLDRAAFFKAPVVDYQLELLMAGTTTDNELRGYFVHENGVSEPLEQYGTIGSGAAYAELFLRYLIAGPQIDVKQASRLAVYVIKGVGLMDPNVGGTTSVAVITNTKKGEKGEPKLTIGLLPSDKLPKDASQTMENVLGRIGGLIQEVLGGEEHDKDNDQGGHEKVA